MSKIDQIDAKNAEEEASQLSAEEISFLESGLRTDGVKPELFNDVDKIQIVRGYQTYEPRGEETNKAFKMISEFREKFAQQDFLRQEQPVTQRYNSEIWRETVYGPDKYGHLHIALKFTEIDTKAIEELPEDVLIRVQAQRLAAYSKYKIKFGIENLGSASKRYKHSLIIDLKGAGMGILSGKKRALVQKVMSVGSDYFPETVWKIYIVNAPFVFRAAWGIAKAWIHPVTQAKVNVLGAPSALAKRLEEQGVKSEDIPGIIGGPAAGVKSYEVIKEMIAYTLSEDNAASAAGSSGKAATVSEQSDETTAEVSQNAVAANGARQSTTKDHSTEADAAAGTHGSRRKMPQTTML